jgi:ribosomal protein S18 acetylase RimI-like enzyme
MPLTKATIADIPQINQLVNNAYRGEESKKGWTSEADLIDGIRINEEMLQEYFGNPAVTILKYLDENGQIVGAVYLENKTPKLYLGMLSVSPTQQGGGVGKALLQEAEVIAGQLGCNSIIISVIRSRKELVNWYERRGYVFTGETQPFHDDGKHGVPKQFIELIVMEKILS